MNDSSPVGLSFTSNFCNTINGRLTTTTEERCSINPATEKPNPEVPVSTTRDVEDAVSAADAAYRKWAQLPQKSRRDAILRFADALEQHSDKFAELLTMEQGKPVSIIRGLYKLPLNAITLPGANYSTGSFRR